MGNMMCGAVATQIHLQEFEDHLQELQMWIAAATADKEDQNQQLLVLKEAHRKCMAACDEALQASKCRAESQQAELAHEAVTEARLELQRIKDMKKATEDDISGINEEETRSQAALEKERKGLEDAKTFLQSIELAAATESATETLRRHDEAITQAQESIVSRLQDLTESHQRALCYLEVDLQQARRVVEEEGRDIWSCQGEPPEDDVKGRQLLQFFKEGEWCQLQEYTSKMHWGRMTWLEITVERRAASLASQRKVDAINLEKTQAMNAYEAQKIDLEGERDALALKVRYLRSLRHRLERRENESDTGTLQEEIEKMCRSSDKERNLQQNAAQLRRTAQELQKKVGKLAVEITAQEEAVAAALAAEENPKAVVPREMSDSCGVQQLEEERMLKDMEFTVRIGAIQTKISMLTAQITDLTQRHMAMSKLDPNQRVAHNRARKTRKGDSK